MLPFNDFLQVVRDAPLVSIDLIVENEAGQYLFGLRQNDPAKGSWFVPGGRIHKNEPLDAAFARIVQAELGVVYARDRAQWHGLYEHFYESNAGQLPGFGTHYVVLAHKLRVTAAELCLPDGDQHHAWCWKSRQDIVSDPAMHRHVRDYFVFAE